MFSHSFVLWRVSIPECESGLDIQTSYPNISSWQPVLHSAANCRKNNSNTFLTGLDLRRPPKRGDDVKPRHSPVRRAADAGGTSKHGEGSQPVNVAGRGRICQAVTRDEDVRGARPLARPQMWEGVSVFRQAAKTCHKSQQKGWKKVLSNTESESTLWKETKPYSASARSPGPRRPEIKGPALIWFRGGGEEMTSQS